VLIVGYAWQKGLLPLTAEAFEAAIEANGAAVSLNKRAFAWGRLAAVDPDAVDTIAGIAKAPAVIEESLEEMVARRVADLTQYQDATYAARYAALMKRVLSAGAELGTPAEAFRRAVAANAYKLMAYKDEYEVARLYADPSFQTSLEAQFADTKRISVWLAPPLLSRTDARTGRPAKRKFGPWVFTAFRALASARRLRGTWADPFGYTAERKAERELAGHYEAMIVGLCDTLDSASLGRAAQLASLPDQVRGYGPVKEAAMEQYYAQVTALQSAKPAPVVLESVAA
jgi:indolepyruvate ferredoxin oxidoreductase